PPPACALAPASFAARCARLTPLFSDGLVVLFGEKNPIDAWEEHANDPLFRVGPFRQEENLFYLTGLAIPDVAVVIDAAAGNALAYGPTGAPPGHADGGAELRAEVHRLGLSRPEPTGHPESDLAPKTVHPPVY